MKAYYTKTTISFEGNTYKFDKKTTEDIISFIKVVKPNKEQLHKVLFQESKSISNIITINSTLIEW